MKLEALHTKLIDHLTNEIVTAGQWCWYYKHENPMDSHYTAWVSYRLWVMQLRKYVQDFDTFRQAVNTNWMNCHSVLFAQN